MTSHRPRTEGEAPSSKAPTGGGPTTAEGTTEGTVGQGKYQSMEVRCNQTHDSTMLRSLRMRPEKVSFPPPLSPSLRT